MRTGNPENSRRSNFTQHRDSRMPTWQNQNLQKSWKPEQGHWNRNTTGPSDAYSRPQWQQRNNPQNAGYNHQPNVSTIVKTPNEIRDREYTTELELQLAEMHTQFNRVVTIQKEM